MGQYFGWVNVDKHEFIEPIDFDLGSKWAESLHWGNPLLKALYALLSEEWKGDHIVFLGDQYEIPADETNPLLQRMRKEQDQYSEYCGAYEMVWESSPYKCVNSSRYNSSTGAGTASRDRGINRSTDLWCEDLCRESP